MKWDIRQVEKTDSTNSDLLRKHPNLKSGAVLVATEQIAGRGRDDREFVSPKGGLYFSLALQRSYPISTYPLMAALAVHRSLLSTAGVYASIKWPNDLSVEGKKVCGILCESVADFLVIGVGVNTNSTLCDFPDALRNKITTLAEKKLDNRLFLEKILHQLEDILTCGFVEVKSEYEKNCITLGSMIDIPGKGKCLASGITLEGELIVSKGENLFLISSPGLIT